MSKYLHPDTVFTLLTIKREEEEKKKSKSFKGVIKSNRDIAEEVLGNRKAESTVRRVWKEFCKKGHYRAVTGDKPIAGGTKTLPSHKRKKLNGKRFVFTSAQNNTFIHEEFFESIKTFCNHKDAQLFVSSFYYNRDGFQNGKRDKSWFDDRVKPYMLDESVEVADGLIFNGELNILPTAVNPLSGLYNYNGSSSGIVPHAKLQMESLPHGKFEQHRALYTTGALTQRNYIPQKAGQKAEWNHTFSALYVEVDEDGDWFVYQLNAESDTGEFYLFHEKYTPKGVVVDSGAIAAINLGDIHAESVDGKIASSCWKDKDSFVANLVNSNTKIMAHDVLDFKFRNHHRIKDPYYLFKQFTDKKEDVKYEVRNTCQTIEDLGKHGGKVIVVESNHNEALERWLKEQDYRKDPVNALFFLEMQLENYKSIAKGDNLETFKKACEISHGGFDSDVLFLKRDESYTVVGIECGEHGDKGNNGSRGSINAYLKRGIKMNVGHSHSAAIKDGVFYAGACIRPQDTDYAAGGSSWSISHIITYKNGKRTIVTMKNGKYKGY